MKSFSRIVRVAFVLSAVAFGRLQAEVPATPYWLDVTKNCGAMCLHFVNGLLGGEQNYVEIAALCPPGQDGVNLDAIATAAGKLGYQAAGFRARAWRAKASGGGNSRAAP